MGLFSVFNSLRHQQFLWQLLHLKCKKVPAAAKALFVQPAEDLSTLRVEGLDTPGSCSRIVSAIAAGVPQGRQT
jgi:hypothetical protein